MRKHYSWPLRLLLAVALTAMTAMTNGHPALAQTTVKKVVLQAFWWDYYNDTYRFKWADYLAELAPRLRGLGVDAVWIPPTPKNKNATNDVGYSPFDHYDLGDKYQKGDTRTRFGSKDEFLRMVAVLHANGIEVIQDVVLNHIDGAGGTFGYGGQDPDSYSTQTNSGYKNFRYSCFGTPAPQAEPAPSSGTEAGIAAEYLGRQGRWPKNYANFHPHLGHNSTTGDLASPLFGPDFCFGDDGGGDGYGGLSAGVTGPYPTAYNPVQPAGYLRDEARRWIVWHKKQTGVDGFRWDAVKHFSYPVQQDLSFNLKYNAGWANGGETMFNVGEYVGGKAQLDGYVGAVNAQNGGTDFLLGTFDFGLREGLYNLVYGSGNFDVGSLPGLQQNQRVQYYAGSNTFVHRTVPFVNNHDTFRPQLSATGNYTGWNTASELAPHIDPFEPRLAAAYAVALAVDGAPQLFFEDLFDLGGTGKRYAHVATSSTDLPVRPDLENLLWCHQNLDFKNGAYRVRYQSQDHLVIERGGRALVGINDNFSAWQGHYVDSDFAPGTVLKDYSGANGTATYTVPPDQRVLVNTPPCNGSAALGRRGYSVWAPVGQDNDNYQPARTAATTQEWEMADDLGDLHCASLGQGGALPANSTNTRLVGKIFAQAGQPIAYELYPGAAGNTASLTVGLCDLRGRWLSSASGTAAALGSYTPPATGWYALKVRNTLATSPGQRCFVKATYTAPAVLDTRTAPAARNAVAIWTGNNRSADPTDCRNWENGVEPSASTDVLVPAGTDFAPRLGSGTLAARDLTIEAGASLTLAAGTALRLAGNLTLAGTVAGTGNLVLAGSAEQTIGSGSAAAVALPNLTVSNAAHVRLLNPLTINETLTFEAGRLRLTAFDLTLGAAATIAGAGAGSYVETPDAAAGGGALRRPVPTGGAAVAFPVGTAGGFAPVALANTGTGSTFAVRTFGGVLANGGSGAAFGRQAEFVNRTWEIVPASASGPVVTVGLAFAAAEQNAGFGPAQAAFYRNDGGAGAAWGQLGPAPATGSGPVGASFGPVSAFGFFALGNAAAPLPVVLTAFEARRTGPSTVGLRWTTAQELDNAGFDVEKSATGAEFTRLATVPAGPANQPNRYAYADRNAAAAYYRLRQRDRRGPSALSPVAYVAAGPSPYYLLPNPSRGESLQLLGGPAQPDTTPLHLVLSNALGTTVFTTAPAPRAALAEPFSAALRRAAPGLYLLTISGPDGQPQRLRVVRE